MFHLIVLCVCFAIFDSFAVDAFDSRNKTCEPFDSFSDQHSLSDTEFLTALTHHCRYDKLNRPHEHKQLPINVSVRMFLAHIEASGTNQMQFKFHMILQLIYMDKRLAFERKNEPILMGQKWLHDQIWVPHIYIVNEKDTSITGFDKKDVQVAIHSNGQIVQTTRLRTTLYCWMNLVKFPFDKQNCEIILKSWVFNGSDLLLRWHSETPVVVASQLHLTEYSFLDYKLESGLTESVLNMHGNICKYFKLNIMERNISKIFETKYGLSFLYFIY